MRMAYGSSRAIDLIEGDLNTADSFMTLKDKV